MQAILPVAGLGTRFLPWTKAVPKEMLPLGTKPIIAHLVDECLDAGITDICFVISEGKEALINYFKEDPRLTEELARRDKLHHIEDLKRYDSIRLHTVYQNDQLGDGHAILQAADWVKGPVAVLFGDDLFIGGAPGVRQLMEAHKHVGNEGAIIALENIPRELTHKYGIVEVTKEHETDPRLKKLKGMVEKPHPDSAPSTLGIVGRYILPKSTFAILPKVGASHGGEIRIIDALIEQLNSEPVHGYECRGTRLDTGTPEGYREAVRRWGE